MKFILYLIFALTLINNIESKKIIVIPRTSLATRRRSFHRGTGCGDQHVIQRAICELKGLPTYYDTNNTDKSCGYQSSNPDIDPEVMKRGGTIQLLPGEYYFTGQLHVYSNIIIEGAGMDLTTIKLCTNSTEFDNSGIIRFASNKVSSTGEHPVVVRNLVIKDLTIDGQKDGDIFDASNPLHKGRYGFYTLYATNIYISRVRIINCQGYGFDPHGVPGEDLPTSYMTIENCYAENNNLDGFTIDKSLNVIINNCYSIGNARHGFELTTGTAEIQFTNNHAINNGHYYWSVGDNKHVPGCGIRAQDQFNNGARWGSKLAIFSNNIIADSADYGFCISEMKEVLVTSNIITRSGTGCIRLMDSDESYIGVDDSIISNNICIRNNRGIVIQQSHRNAIVGNSISNNNPEDQWGLMFEDSNNNVVRSNVLINSKGIDLDNSEGNDVEYTLDEASSPSNNFGNCCYWVSCDFQTQSQCVGNGGGWLGNNPCNNISCHSIPPDIPPPLNIMSVKTIKLEEANGYRIIKTFKNDDLLETNIEYFGFVAFSQLIPGTAIRAVFELEDVDFHPERFEYTSDETNNDLGIIFDISTDDLIGNNEWVVGFNTMEHVLLNEDYVADSGVINYGNMNRLQLYWTENADTDPPPNISITIHEIEIGNPLDF